MTKTLTEQWREGKLPNGNYYTICSGWNMETFPCIVYCERNCFDANVIEVLSPVPSYEEYKRLQEQKQKVIALIKDGRFVEALQELENETLA